MSSFFSLSKHEEYKLWMSLSTELQVRLGRFICLAEETQLGNGELGFGAVVSLQESTLGILSALSLQVKPCGTLSS